MDFKRLMEEAKANQERKSKKLAKMREINKQNEVEKRIREREILQAQTQARKVSRINHATNHTLKDGKKQSELLVRHKKKPIETNTKIPTRKEDLHKHKQHNTQTQKQQNPTLHSQKPKIKTEEKNGMNKSSQNNKTEKRELNSKPPVPASKQKAALSYKEMMELAKKNIEKKSDKSSAPPPPPSHNTPPGLKLDSDRNNTAEKRRNLEESSKPTDSSKKAKLNKKGSQPPPQQQPPKPRPQIQQSDYFRKTFDKSSSIKKPQFQAPKYGASKGASKGQEPDESSSDEDGFIVSDDEESSNFNVSAFIQNMFRYNKSKYANEDAEAATDESMVSSFSRQQFEEKRSARIGYLEDMEDIKREEGELRKKFLAKRKKDKKLKRLQN